MNEPSTMWMTHGDIPNCEFTHDKKGEVVVRFRTEPDDNGQIAFIDLTAVHIIQLARELAPKYIDETLAIEAIRKRGYKVRACRWWE